MFQWLKNLFVKPVEAKHVRERNIQRKKTSSTPRSSYRPTENLSDPVQPLVWNDYQPTTSIDRSSHQRENTTFVSSGGGEFSGGGAASSWQSNDYSSSCSSSNDSSSTDSSSSCDSSSSGD